MVVFSLISIPTLIPFLQLLFKNNIQVPKAPDMNVGNWTKYLDYLQYHFYLFIQEEGRHKALIYVCVFIILVFFLKNLFRFLSLYFMVPVRTGIVRDLRNKIYNQFLSVPLSFFKNKKKGDLISRITSDVMEVEWSILNVLEAIVKEPLMIIGCLAYMLFVSPSLTLFVLLMVVITGGIIGVIGSQLRKGSAKAQKILGELTSITEESLSASKIIKAFNAESYMIDKFYESNESYRNTINPVFRRKDLSSPLSEFLGITVVAALLIIGANYVFSGRMGAEVFLSFLFAFYNIIPPAKSFANGYYSIKKGMAASDRINQILNINFQKEEAEETKDSNVLLLEDFQDEIHFQNVSFSYENEEVLKNIDLKIKKGEIVALVGGSGAGKTTLTDLLMRLYKVNKGTIMIDGVNIQNYLKESLRSLFGLVAQEAILFNDTIKNNILFGRNHLKEEDIIQAAKIANAHEFINNTPSQYDTNIGDRGNQLSGGQAQRLTIARAILNNPPILILDEATSALDSESEKVVQEALQKVMKGRTVIIIAHRLSTIRYADKIVVMDKGQIVEQGTHQSLLDKKGHYFKLVQMQSV